MTRLLRWLWLDHPWSYRIVIAVGAVLGWFLGDVLLEVLR